jgi:polyphosphate kinase
MRADREVGAVFNLLTGYSGGGEIQRLIVAPFDMRRRLLRLIERETQHASEGGRPGSACSSTASPIAASSARSTAHRSRRPHRDDGARDLRAAAGRARRLRQHQRRQRRRPAAAACPHPALPQRRQDEYYIGSADWRPRNLNERVEVVTPVTEPEHRALLDRILTDTLNDPGAWRLGPNGEHARRNDRPLAVT